MPAGRVNESSGRVDSDRLTGHGLDAAPPDPLQAQSAQEACAPPPPGDGEIAILAPRLRRMTYIKVAERRQRVEQGRSVPAGGAASGRGLRPDRLQ